MEQVEQSVWSEALKLDVCPARTPGRGQCGNLRTWPEDEAARVEGAGSNPATNLILRRRVNVERMLDKIRTVRDVVAKRALHSTTTKSRGSGDCFRLIDDEDVVGLGRPARGVAGTCIEGRFGAKDGRISLDILASGWSDGVMTSTCFIQFCRCGLRRARNLKQVR